MANKNHVELLFKFGSREWNRWIAQKRRKHTDFRPDLSEIDLTKIDLAWVNFSGVNLSQTNLSNTNLRYTILANTNLCRTNLADANLYEVDLSKSNLSGAILNGADLSDAKLSHTYLIGARLLGANLSGADLFGANFNNTTMGFTNFSNTDLSKCLGLETVKHLYPSIIGTSTVLKSHGNIPELFLRNAEVTEEIIKQTKSFIKKPWWYHSCYISYSSDDQEIAHRLHTDLQKSGVKCWLGAEDLKMKHGISLHVAEAIDINDRLLIILSESSITSPWIESLVESVLEKENRLADEMSNRLLLLPICIDNSIMETSKTWADKVCCSRHISNFKDWKDYYSYQDALRRLLIDLRQTETK